MNSLENVHGGGLVHRTLAAVAAAVLAATFAPAAGAESMQDFADWTAVTGSPAAASGTLHGDSVTLAGTAVLASGSTVDGSSTVFNRVDFTPPLSTADAINVNAATGNSYTLTFARPVTNPVLDVASLGSTLHFPSGTQIALLSGDAQLSVSSSDLIGQLEAPTDDANGTVRLAGSFSSLSFTTTSSAATDGVYLQVGATAADHGPPVNTSQPALSGSPVEGDTMSCSPGGWNGQQPITFAYQWLRDSAPILGSSGSSYSVATADVSHTLGCQVTASNALGRASAVAAGVFLTPTPPRSVVAPMVTAASRQVGSTFGCSTGQWTGSPTSYGFQWFRGSTPIQGASASTYRTGDDDTFLSIACSVDATNGAGPGHAVSNQVIPQPTVIGAKYYHLGASRGFLGPPTGPEQAAPGGRFRDYRGGSIYWSAATGAHEVHGLIGVKWLALGGVRGFLGYPTTDELVVKKTGRYNEFRHGVIYWSPATAAHEVHGLILEHWSRIGRVSGVTGFPTSDELVTADRRGRRSEFEHASMYWSPQSGAHEVHGAIRAAWRGDLGRWGYPITDEVPTDYGAVGAYNNFQHGEIHWSSRNGIESATRCPHWACKDGRARSTCDPARVAAGLRAEPNERLSPFERATGEAGTILKRLHFLAKGWASKGCFVHNAVGVLVRSPQWSTDDIWTADVRLEAFDVEGAKVSRTTRYIRLEIEPNNRNNTGYAHALLNGRGPSGKKIGCVLPLCGPLPRKLFSGSNIPPGTQIRFGGLIVLDSDHGFLEVHPDTEFSIV